MQVIRESEQSQESQELRTKESGVARSRLDAFRSWVRGGVSRPTKPELQVVPPGESESVATMAPSTPSLWQRTWQRTWQRIQPNLSKIIGITAALNFVVIFTLFAFRAIPGVEQSLLGLFALAALIEIASLVSLWKNALHHGKGTQDVTTTLIATTVLNLAIVAAVGLAVLSYNDFGLFNIDPLIVPLMFTVAIGIKAFLHFSEAGKFAIRSRRETDSIKRKDLKQKAREQFGLSLIMGAVTAAIPTVLVYELPYLNWLGVAASGLWVVWQIFEVAYPSKPKHPADYANKEENSQEVSVSSAAETGLSSTFSRTRGSNNDGSWDSVSSSSQSSHSLPSSYLSSNRPSNQQFTGQQGVYHTPGAVVVKGGHEKGGSPSPALPSSSHGHGGGNKTRAVSNVEQPAKEPVVIAPAAQI